MEKYNFTKSDVYWAILFFFISLALLIGCIYIAIIYLIPNLLEQPNTLPRVGNDMILEYIIVLSSIIVGIILPFIIISIISKTFLSTKTYTRWEAQLESGKHKLPRLNRMLAKALLKAMKPRHDKKF